MKLTQEQNDIIRSNGNIKINAVAGSGKTTTIIEYAKARPKNSKILYLAFNRSVKLEAMKKFAAKSLDNVKVETAHSLAYKHIVFKHGYKVRSQGYKTYELVDLLNLQKGDDLVEFVIANHILKFIAYFCNSDKRRVQELDYLDVVTDYEAKRFVRSFYSYIESQTRRFLTKMDKREIEITHDFYLKKFQLSNTRLPYDYILFDEGQDASPAMLDVFFRQNATKVIVGDTHQQIYGWRHAVNSLEQAEFRTYYLSKSFRFSQEIANLAMGVLKWKNHLGDFSSIPIEGKGEPASIHSKAVLARTNLGLLVKAIEYVKEKKNIRHIYFEGNINSYTYAEDGTSLYDVLNLFNNKRRLIRDQLIRQMKDLEELENYVEKTEDMQLGMMVEIVKEYQNEIPGLIKKIKELHVEDKEQAEMIFSTVHRCKGMEYDAIQIVNDFITEEKLEEIKNELNEGINKPKLNEEINLLYVAVTRTKNTIYIPETLLPEDFSPTPQIRVLKVDKAEEEGDGQAEASVPEVTEKAYTYEEVRAYHEHAYKPWTPKMDEELSRMYGEGVHVKDLSKHFGRTKGAIISRLIKLEIIEE
jgi:F-box protein, helicase, 18